MCRPTAWMVGRPFNGNANDESGNGNNGSVNGAIISNDRNGLLLSAFKFDGSQSIDVLGSITINSIRHKYSIACWVLINSWKTSGPGHFSIIDKSNSCPGTAGSFPFLFIAANSINGFHVQNID